MSRHITSGAATLAAEQLSSGPAAVALHAGVTDRRSFGPLAAALDGRLGVVAYDRRGFGETVCAPEPHRATDDLRAVLDAVVPSGPAWLLGSSQGGRIALQLALAEPERVAGLVLLAPALAGEEDAPELAGHEQALADAIDAAWAAGDHEACNRLEARLWLDGAGAPEGRVAGAPRRLVLEANGAALRAPDPGPVLDDGLELLEALELPLLVIVGDLDLAHVIAGAEELTERVPTARLARIPNAAHLPHLERPGQVAAAIGVFLQAAAR